MLEVCVACQLPLRDPASADELWPGQPVTAGISPKRHSRRRFIQFPTRRLVAARDAAQIHTILLKLKQSVVTVKAAYHLPQPVDHATAKAVQIRANRRFSHLVP